MSRGKTHRLVPETFRFTYDAHAPALRVKSGDTVVASTRDARGYDEHGKSMPARMADKRDDTEFWPSNPLVGPVYVEDAEPGDAISVQIRRIRLNRATAWSTNPAHFGCFTGEGPGRRMNMTPPMRTAKFLWKLDLKKNTGSLQLRKSRMKKVTIPLHPFIGSIGVAPRFGCAATALTPGDWGGNMDCVETCKGATLHLPVWVRGACLAFGDVHAAQGDGEVCGVALETTAEVAMRIDVRKGWGIEWPRIENKTHIMVAASTRPLFETMALSHTEMVRWLSEDYGFESGEALQVLSQVGTTRVGNVVDPNYTVVAKFPKKYLPKRSRP